MIFALRSLQEETIEEKVGGIVVEDHARIWLPTKTGQHTKSHIVIYGKATYGFELSNGVRQK